MRIKKIVLLVPVLAFLSTVFWGGVSAATGTLNTGSTHQTIVGFGGGLMFGVFPCNGPEAMKDEIYDSLFCRAGFNVVRIGNFYDPDRELAARESDAVNFNVGEVPMMLEIQERWPDIKTFMASWSPPPSIKSNNSIEGKDTTTGAKATLKQSGGSYMYSEYADYWHKSLEFFTDTGITIDWFSIQNEPDWPADWDGCLFLPTESAGAASYGIALDVVYDRCRSFNIPIIGPDMTGISGIDGNSLQVYLNNSHLDKLYAICHHFYSGYDPASMRSVRQLFPGKPKFQTEYLINEEKEWNGSVQTWFEHLQIVHHALVEEDISMYLLFALVYKQASTHCCISLDSTAEGDYSSPQGYAVRPIYFGFKHYSKSINRGWKRVDISVDQSGLMASAFIAPSGDSLSVVVINTGTSATGFQLNGVPGGLSTCAVYQTTQLEARKTPQGRQYEDFGEIGPNDRVTLDPLSITTFEFPRQVPPEMPPVENRPSRIPARMKPDFSIVSASVPGNGILITFNTPVAVPYTLSVYDLCGNRAAIQSGGSLSGKTVSHLFSGRFAKGVYAVRLAGEGIETAVGIAVVH